MVDAGVVSYSAGGAMFLLLTLLLVTAWPGRLQGALLLTACAASAAWCGVLAAQAAFGAPGFRLLEAVEIGRDATWFAFLFGILGLDRRTENRGISLRLLDRLVLAACAVLSSFLLIQWYYGGAAGWNVLSGRTTMLLHVMLAVTGLALVEQVFRNTRPEHRWAIKFLCFGVGGMFAYDLYLYSDALLFQRIDPVLWTARGAVNALVVPLIAVSAARNPEWRTDIFVSRHVIFHSATLLGTGAYLLLMSAAGYYIRIYGGSWGGVAQTVFLFGAVLLLALLMFSGQLRARVKVFVGKHFFRNRYDYREEWLRFTNILSRSEHDRELRENIIRGIAGIVDSPGGLMWMRRDTGHFHAIARWNLAQAEMPPEPVHSPLVEFMQARGWVVFLDELVRTPERYPGVEPPAWLGALREPWLVVPLMLREELLGFVVLQRSATKRNLNWEDSDLLKTVGREAASYLALLKVSEALTDARQFEAFNRLSSYVVHDLKNLAAQLQLVVSNAKRFGTNPEFLADAMQTVENATTKMNRLLAQLRKGRVDGTPSSRVQLAPILGDVVAARAERAPVPALTCEESTLAVTANADRLAAVLEHVVQNAQEATQPEGEVSIRLTRRGDSAVIEVEDTGCGMDGEFIAERLFRPFDTTKGNAGMGIGVFESREFVREHGGDIEVESKPGEGTRFRILLPLAAEPQASASLAPAEVAR